MTLPHSLNTPLHCLFFLFILGNFMRIPAYAQEKAPSPAQRLSATTNDSLRTIAYVKIFHEFEYLNPDSAIVYAKKGVAEFGSKGYLRGEATLLSQLGGIYATQGFADLSDKTAQEALRIFTTLGNKPGIAATHNTIGVTAGRKGDYPTANEHFLTALKIYDDVDDTDGMVSTYIKLGTATIHDNNFNGAMAYYRKGVALMGYTTTSAPARLGNLIYLYNNIGAAYCRFDKFDTALTYLEKALSLSNDTDYSQVRLLTLNNLGLLYNSIHQSPKALEYYNQALALTTREKLPEDKARLLINMSYLVAETDPKKALASLNEALAITYQIGQRVLRSDALIAMIDIYKMQGNYKDAFRLLEQNSELTDSIFNIDKTRTIANMQAVYDLDHANAQLQKLELAQQQHLQRKNASIMIAALLAVVLAIVIFFLLKTRKLNMQLAAQKTDLAKANDIKDKLFSIIGHDLMGSISNIPAGIQLCRNNEIPGEEREILLEMLEKNAAASLETLENLLNWGKAQIKGITLNPATFVINDQLQEELRLVDAPAAAKQLRIQNGIPATLTIYADPDHFKFIMRNLLHNAVKYSHMGGKIVLSADTGYRPGYVVCTITDDGIGITDLQKAQLFDASSISVAGTASEKGNGIGLLLSKEFAHENGGRIWAESIPGKGSVFFCMFKAQK